MAEPLDVTVVKREEQEGGGALIRPAAEPKAVLGALAAFSSFKSQVLRSVENATCRIGDKEYLKKEAWVTAKLAFRIKTEVVRESWQRLPDGSASFVCVVRATAPNGDSAEAVGVCDTREDFYRQGKKIPNDEAVPEGVLTYRVRDKYGNWNRYLPKPLSAIAGFAQTRAQNRAISTLIGGGENSAEEMTGDDAEERPAPSRPAFKPVPAAPPSQPRQPEPGHSATPITTGVSIAFGKHKGEDIGVIETSYLEWMASKPLAEDDERFGQKNALINSTVRKVLAARKAPAKKAPLPDERVVEGDIMEARINEGMEERQSELTAPCPTHGDVCPMECQERYPF